MEPYKDEPGGLDADLEALRGKVETQTDKPAPKPVTMRLVLRRENEELPPSEDRYAVIQNMNYFPAKNTYTHAELLALFDEGVQISVRT